MIAWIASYPRSGNSFFRIALHRLYGYRSVHYGSRGVKPAGHQDRPIELWTDMTDAEMAAQQDLYFVKTHELPQDSTSPAIYLVRDGRDALVSYTWFSLVQHQGVLREQITREQFREVLFHLMVDARGPYGVWSSNVLAWLRRPNTFLVKFEQLIRTPEKCIADAMQSLSLPGECLGGRVPTFEELQADRPHHYRRGQVGAWCDEFPADLLDQFWCLHGEAMEAAGYASTPSAAWRRAAEGASKTRRCDKATPLL